MDNWQAIRCMKEGDISGLDFLVTRYQVKAVHAAFLITHDQQTAEDTVQGIFLRIHGLINQFNEKSPFEPYLMRSVLNAAIDTAEKNSEWVPLEGGDETGEANKWIACASPDGRWLALSALDPDPGSFLSTLTLIEVDTCRIVPLSNLHNYRYTWKRSTPG